MRQYILFLVFGVLLFSLMSATVLKKRTAFTSETNESAFQDFYELIEVNSEESCNSKDIKRNTKIFLGKYEFESFSYKPYSVFVNKRKVSAIFSAYAGEGYRIIDLCEGFESKVTMNIYDPKGYKIYTSDSNYKIFDFLAENSGDYTIEWIFSREDYTKPNKKCVAFALGYFNE